MTPQDMPMTEPTKRAPPPKALPADHLAFPAAHFTGEQLYVNAEHLDVQLADLFVPAFWRLHLKKLRRHAIVRVIGRDFDVLLTVDEMVGFGVKMRPFNWVAPGSATHDMLSVLMGPDGPAAGSQAAADAEIAGMARGAA